MSANLTFQAFDQQLNKDPTCLFASSLRLASINIVWRGMSIVANADEDSDSRSVFEDLALSPARID
jgi:hypothetical protein